MLYVVVPSAKRDDGAGEPLRALHLAAEIPIDFVVHIQVPTQLVATTVPLAFIAIPSQRSRPNSTAPMVGP